MVGRIVLGSCAAAADTKATDPPEKGINARRIVILPERLRVSSCSEIRRWGNVGASVSFSAGGRVQQVDLRGGHAQYQTCIFDPTITTRSRVNKRGAG